MIAAGFCGFLVLEPANEVAILRTILWAVLIARFALEIDPYPNRVLLVRVRVDALFASHQLLMRPVVPAATKEVLRGDPLFVLKVWLLSPIHGVEILKRIFAELRYVLCGPVALLRETGVDKGTCVVKRDEGEGSVEAEEDEKENYEAIETPGTAPNVKIIFIHHAIIVSLKVAVRKPRPAASQKGGCREHDAHCERPEHRPGRHNRRNVRVAEEKVPRIS